MSDTPIGHHFESPSATPLPQLEGEAPVGTLPKPGVRRDTWQHPPQPLRSSSSSPSQASRLYGGGGSSRPGSAAMGGGSVSNTEAAFALDIQSFGLQNSQLQHALSSMLKAIVSLSEDHKVVRVQLETFQNASREAQTTLAMDIDALNDRIGQDYVSRKDWTEARYDDHRRTDRVAQNLHEFQQEQLTGMTAVLPRISAIEQQMIAAQHRLKIGEERFAVADDVRAALEKRAVAEEEQSALNGRRFATLDAELTHLRDDTNAELTELKRGVGSLTDVAEENRAAIAKTATIVRRDTEAIDELQAEVASACRRIAESTARAEERLQSARDHLEKSISDVSRGLADQRKADHERVTKAENHFLFQVASFEAVSQDHGLKLKALVSDAEAVKAELAGLNFTAESASERATDAVARSQAETQQALKKLRDDVASLKTANTTLERAFAVSSEDSTDALEHAVGDLRARIKALEGRKKADDAQFRDFLTAKVSDEIEAAVREGERRRDAAKAKDGAQVRKSITAATEAVAALQTRVSELELMCESAIDTVNTLGDSAHDTLGRSTGTARDGQLIATLLSADLNVLRRLAADEGAAGASEGASTQNAILRYRRTLDWSASRPQSPQRPTRAPQAPPAFDPRNHSPLGSPQLQPQQRPDFATVSDTRASMNQQQHQQQQHHYGGQSDSNSAASSRRGSPVHRATPPSTQPPTAAAVAPPQHLQQQQQQEAFVDPRVSLGGMLDQPPAHGFQHQRIGGGLPQQLLRPPSPPRGARTARDGTDTPDELIEEVSSPSAAAVTSSSTAAAPPLPSSLQYHQPQQQQQSYDHHQRRQSLGVASDRSGSAAAGASIIGEEWQADLPTAAAQRRSNTSTVSAPSAVASPQPSRQYRGLSPPRPTNPGGGGDSSAHLHHHGSSGSASTTGGAPPPPQRKAPLGVEINNAPGGGVVVLKVEEGGAADVAGLSAGDVVVGFGDEAIGAKEAFRAAYLAATGGGAVVLTVIPGGRPTAARLQLTLLL